MGVLDGITVLALEQAVAAPFATRQLADLGARVVKVERPGVGDFARHYDRSVDGQSSHFVWLNRSKESLALDLKQPEAVGIVRELAATADVFVENLAPGACDRLGLAATDLRRANPRLVTCSISGYGSTGPFRDKKAYDLLIQCETGLVSITGSPDQPAKVGISIADIAGGMYAYSGILTALLHRERGTAPAGVAAAAGAGQHVEVSLMEALGEWMGFPAYYTYGSGTELPRTGARHPTIQPYGPFRAGDGSLVQLGIQNEREFGVFCAQVLGQPGLAVDTRFADNTSRCAHIGELTTVIEQAFAGLSAGEVVDRLDGAGIANARLNTVGEFLKHPSLSARERWREVGTPAGVVPALVPPATLSGAPVRMDPVPAVGEHTTAILAELGRSPADIADLADRGVVGLTPSTPSEQSR